MVIRLYAIRENVKERKRPAMFSRYFYTAAYEYNQMRIMFLSLPNIQHPPFKVNIMRVYGMPKLFNNVSMKTLHALNDKNHSSLSVSFI